MAETRILLADDHPVVRSGIRNLIERDPDLLVIGEAGSGKEALRLVKELAPDVLLLDMEMPDISGNDVALQLSREKSPVRILALSAHADRQYIKELLSSGASGYLIKEEVPDTIIEAIKGIARGEQGWVSRTVAAQMSQMVQGEETGFESLTPREKEVLMRVAEGKTNQEIGFDLGISEKTVEKHLEGVFSKLEVNSRVEAAVMAVRKGIKSRVGDRENPT
jgi:DNA-binding NarL/FixJ family response regulator